MQFQNSLVTTAVASYQNNYFIHKQFLKAKYTLSGTSEVIEHEWKEKI